MSMSKDQDHTWELFEAMPRNYRSTHVQVQDNPKDNHIWAAPPVTKSYTTQCGVVIDVPDI